MARKTSNPNVEDITQDELTAARKQARAKLARQMAEQELGIGDTTLPVVKGPMPMPDEQIVAITIDLAPYADRIVIDSVHYMQGRTYELGQRLAAVVNEQISRTWGHQAEIEGKDHEFYLKNRLRNSAVSANLGTRVPLARSA